MHERTEGRAAKGIVENNRFCCRKHRVRGVRGNSGRDARPEEGRRNLKFIRFAPNELRVISTARS
jgi:hypothetical protein